VDSQIEFIGDYQLRCKNCGGIAEPVLRVTVSMNASTELNPPGYELPYTHECECSKHRIDVQILTESKPRFSYSNSAV